MHRFGFGFIFAFVFGILLPAHASTPPNIVVFLADDLGYGELGCYGQKWIKTPHLDQLANEGMRFTDFYSGNAVCAPSRCCLLTGKHPGQAFVRGNGDPRDLQYMKSKMGWEFPGQNPIPAREFTIAEMLKPKGYATAAIGKWGLGHFGTSGDPNRQGFDLFYGFNCQRHAHNHYPKFLWRNNVKEIQPGNDRTLYGKTFSQDQFTKVAIEFIRESKNQPFFLYLPFAIPHLSIQVTEDSLAQYEGKIPEEDYKHRGYLKHPSPRAGYAAMVSHMDRDIGRILTELREQGLDDNTLVIFTSDNGPTFERLGGADSDFFDSSAGLRARKGSLYEGGIRVPMIAKWPGKIRPQSESSRPAAFWDLMPTLAEVIGDETPESCTGQSFLNELLGKECPAADYLYWEFPSYGGQQAIRQGRWKAIRQKMSRAKSLDAVPLELYDLQTDPGETENVAAANQDIAGRLSNLMASVRTPNERFPFRVLDQLTKKESVNPKINQNFVKQDLEVQEWLDRFEVESREIYTSREAIVQAIGLKPGEVIADIGAGTGLFSFMFAEQVKEDGHVLALDIAPAFIEHISTKVKESGIKNITPIRCRVDSTTLSTNSVDAVFVCDTYHHFEFPAATLESIRSSLKPGGRLIVVDFDRIPGVSRDWLLGHIRADKATFRSEIEQAGFRFVGEADIAGLKENYFLHFQRP